MAITDSEKEDIIGELLVAKQKGQIVEAKLRFKARADEADKVQQRTELLSDEIDRLLGEAMEEWIGESDQIDAKITKANAAIQKSIREIQGT